MAPYKEERRHSGHYIGKTETFWTPHKEDKRHFGHHIGRQKTFRTPHRKTEDIPDTT